MCEPCASSVILIDPPPLASPLDCALVRITVDTCLRKILMERNVPGAISYVKQVIADLLQNKLVRARVCRACRALHL